MKEIKVPKIKYVRNTQALKKLKLKSRNNRLVSVWIDKNPPRMTNYDEEIMIKRFNNLDIGWISLWYPYNPLISVILRDIGIAKSLSEAENAGWKKRCEAGISDFLLDKLKEVKDTTNYHNPKGVRFSRIVIINNIKENKIPKIKV